MQQDGDRVSSSGSVPVVGRFRPRVRLTAAAGTAAVMHSLCRKKKPLSCPVSQSTGKKVQAHSQGYRPLCEGGAWGSRVFSACVRGLFPSVKTAGAICPPQAEFFYMYIYQIMFEFTICISIRSRETEIKFNPQCISRLASQITVVVAAAYQPVRLAVACRKRS